ncbi:MAG: hypothetical protein C5B58_14140 [Acidobacteria bacterium]|nr:MAG: hypothetical protein C5B58_14140 [Acidobacteriota bacterium]
MCYSGIEVDQGYLWVFGSGGFACATHTSVISYLERGNGAPRWIVDYPNDLLYHGDQKWLSQEPPPPLKGLTDLCPCDDGTVVAALYTRTVTNVQVRYSDRSNYFYWKSSVDDSNALYTGSYRTDLKEGKIAVDWAKIPGNGVRVQKLPIFCWPLIEGSIKALTRHGPELALMPWGDGSGVPISGKNLIIVGVDNKSHLHIRIFDDIGKRVTDTDETKLPPGKADAISILKGQLQTLLPRHLLTSAEKVLFIGEVKSIVDQAPSA